MNNSTTPIQLGTEVNQCKIRSTEVAEIKPRSYYCYTTSLAIINADNPCKPIIYLDKITSDAARQIISEIHQKYKEVFDKDLKIGYNEFFGKHECRLNWATVQNYNQSLKSLQQELMDELTDQNVLLMPREHDIKVQSVCPSFIQRKQRSKCTPEHLLTKNHDP